MLMHSIKMTVHLLLKKKKTIHLLHILNHLSCYPYNMSYYHRLRLFTSLHPKLEFGSKTVSL